MNTRRPSTPKGAGADPPRIPFASAEALLWGPELKKQHAYLLTEIHALQKQHEGYNTRIQMAEAIADAIEAATAQIRHLEQKIAVIEAEDENKAFEKWAAGELARLGTFVDANKNIRQKQIELETEVLRVTEDMDGLKGIPTGFRDLLRRLDVLERRRDEDTQRIQRLEGDIVRLEVKEAEKEVEMENNVQAQSDTRLEPSRVKVMGPSPSLIGDFSIPRPMQSMSRLDLSSPRLIGDYSNSYCKPTRKTSASPQTLAVDTSDSTTEPDDELMPLPKRDSGFTRKEVQVPQGPAIQTKFPASIDLTSSRNDILLSATRRIFQSSSIPESRLPQLVGEEMQDRSPVHKRCINLSNSPPAETQIVDRTLQVIASTLVRETPSPKSELPATQLVNRAITRKRKQPDPVPQTQRQTRSQAKMSRGEEVKDEQQQALEGSGILIQPTQLPGPKTSPRKKIKTERASGTTRTNVRSRQPTQGNSKLRGRSTKENADAGSGAKRLVAPTQPATASPRRSKRAKAAVSSTQNIAPAPAPRKAISPTKQKRLMVTLPCPGKMAASGLDGSENKQVGAADRVKASPQKAAVTRLPPLKAKLLSARSKNQEASSPVSRGGYDGKLIRDEEDELLFASA